MDAVRGFAILVAVLLRIQSKRALDILRPAAAGRRFRRQHDFQHMAGVVRAEVGLSAVANAIDQVRQAGGPLPVRIGLVEGLPGLGFVLPEFVAFRRPIVAEQL